MSKSVCNKSHFELKNFFADFVFLFRQLFNPAVLCCGNFLLFTKWVFTSCYLLVSFGCQSMIFW